MNMRVLLISALLGFVSHVRAKPDSNACISANAKTCGECIQTGPQCVWCKDPDFKPSRCDEKESLQKAGCTPLGIENPRGTVTIDKNKPVTNRKNEGEENLRPEEFVQIQPQKFTLNLRSDEPQKFTLTFKRAKDYPIDLYFLMDLSDSMRTNLENVKNLGADLAKEMRYITKDLRIGFGSFLEKLVMPFILTTPKYLENPCFPNDCTAPFSYKNVLSLTNDSTLFTQEVSKQKTSGNLDSPEAGFDAIMQAAVCTKEIGWRNVTRLLVFSTDAGFHFAGDGKLGGIVRPNDGKCHLSNNMYTMGHYFDYPTISQLVDTLSDKNIQTIFAVTEQFRALYEELSALIPKSTVGTLSTSSSNVIQLIIDSYNSLSAEVILENSKLPAGVSISYVSHCKNGVSRKDESGGKCSNISIGDEVKFDIEITAKGCPSNKSETIKIKLLGSNEEVEVVLNFICECECHKDGIPNSPSCHFGNGTLECGVCRCNYGRLGRLCECSQNEVETDDLDANCRIGNETEVCSNNGECVCGTCECKKRDNPVERYSGKFCECDNFSCDRSNNKLCGGHGRCECRKCICDANYTGSACDCPLDTSTCLASNKKICNGRGTCECGMCKCTDSKFEGPTCEMCPTCPRICNEHKDCVECLQFGTGIKKHTCEKECRNFTPLKVVNNKDDLPQSDDQTHVDLCKERDADDCWFYFTYATKNDDKIEVHVAEKKECPSGPDIIPIVAGVVAGIVLIGLALLLIWKLLMIIHDRREFAKFEKEKMNARWDTGENPIYKSAVTTVVNPKYEGK
ncbi:unnamed protein product [Leuciscus chuanchicus]